MYCVRIPGIENAANIAEAYRAQEEVGENVVILGADLRGCEAALHFSRLGRKVRLVESGPAVAPEAESILRGPLPGRLDEYGVEVILNTTCTAIEHDGVRVRMTGDINGAELFIYADTVLVGAGSGQEL
ncbi:MAG: FAD-dependent oxidoreductase [Oscillospiraceae bacterium]|jgi:pyruvate/2-oxoglutarate dehydrogenase complex dihydrolipoamide dehydrogenase (E3) component